MPSTIGTTTVSTDEIGECLECGAKVLEVDMAIDAVPNPRRAHDAVLNVDLVARAVTVRCPSCGSTLLIAKG